MRQTRLLPQKSMSFIEIDALAALAAPSSLETFVTILLLNSLSEALLSLQRLQSRRPSARRSRFLFRASPLRDESGKARALS